MLMLDWIFAGVLIAILCYVFYIVIKDYVVLFFACRRANDVSGMLEQFAQVLFNFVLAIIILGIIVHSLIT